jgi:hypothetical protein
MGKGNIADFSQFSKNFCSLKIFYSLFLPALKPIKDCNIIHNGEEFW